MKEISQKMSELTRMVEDLHLNTDALENLFVTDIERNKFTITPPPTLDLNLSDIDFIFDSLEL